MNEEYFKIQDIYLDLQADLTDCLTQPSLPQPTNETTTTTAAQVPHSPMSFATLPKIQLPTFSGKYEDWPTYQDLFTALVHNTSLSDVQKLHYLKTSVAGEAEMLLRHIQITDSNYTQAWEILKGRFGNKKMIANSILKRLFSQKKVTNQSASQIKTLLDTTTECLNGLNNLKVATDSWDPIIVFLVSQKMDTESLKSWEEHSHNEDSDKMATWRDLQKFLETKFRTLELITSEPSSVRERPQTHKSFHTMAEESEEDTCQITHARVNSRSCVYCNGDHYMYHCKEFAKQTVEHRQEFVKKNNLCRVCHKKHHSLLHRARETNIQPEPTITTAHFSNQQPSTQVLLATAQVQMESDDGAVHTLRALIDQGSEASFVSARVVDLLRLRKTDINGVASGVGEGTKIPLKHLVEIKIKSSYTNKVVNVTAYVLKTISTKLPSKDIIMNWQILQTLNLADPTYNTPGKIDILLGAEVFCKIIEEGLIKLPDGVVAQKTMLGWILSGQRESTEEIMKHNVTTLHITRQVVEDNDMLRKFWEIETDMYKKRKLMTKEEVMCENIYKDSTTRDETGRYIVHLPLKQSIEETVKLCGDTKQQAIARFKQLERKFKRNDKLKTEYTKVIHEYLEMGHMNESKTPDNKLTVYLPHHAVVREDRETTKVRVVFDASAKGSNGHSLNDVMMIGPALQPDLRSLITKWRTHKICIVGDITKMYRMVKMTEEHTDLQRIVWRDDPSDEIKNYNLTTVTFGTAAAPYLAVRTLNQVADDEAHRFPETAPLIKHSFYMDDLMTGAEDVEKAKKICTEIGTILKSGGFEMQKWSSNSEEVLNHIQGEDTIRVIKQDAIIKILGLTWDRKDDKFKATVNLPELKHPVTKRAILSDVGRLFDPFGWLSPVIIIAKMLIQKLWKCKLDWDTELPNHLIEEWKTYRQEIIHLQNATVPRWVNSTLVNREKAEIHGFSDASTQAYAAVTYLRVVEEDEIHVTMIAARTKVAPLKQLSIPKLELSAAALLTELIEDIVEPLSIPKERVFAWTDSTVVLAWLQSDSHNWRTFVANRISDITRVVDGDHWHHVQSAENPADIASRGIKASEVAACKIWWTGPDWLKQDTIQFDKSEIPTTDLELKVSCHTTSVEEKPIWERFSSISRMKRVLAYCRRMIKNTETEPRKNYIEVSEMDKILSEVIKFYQNLVYGREIEEIRRDGTVKKRSSLISLSPYLDEKGILRVGGRLQNAEIGDLVVVKNEDMPPTKWLLGRIKYLHPGEDNIVRE